MEGNCLEHMWREEGGEGAMAFPQSKLELLICRVHSLGAYPTLENNFPYVRMSPFLVCVSVRPSVTFSTLFFCASVRHV